MSEERSLYDSFKNELYTNLLNLIDQKFIEEFISSPQYDPALIEEWCNCVVRAIRNKVITWKQFFAMLQPDFAAVLKAKIIKKAQDQKNYDLLAFLKSMED